jgi:2-octaprenyl-6-methoxyphenol hydroxylase
MQTDIARRRSEKVAVVGGGPAGLVAALVLGAAGVETLLFAPPPPGPDRRTTALLDGSVRVLRVLGVWTLLEPHATPLKKLRLVDATRRLFRAPEVLFDCSELGLDAFGHNIENETLRNTLRAAVERNGRIHTIDAAVEEVIATEDVVRLRAAGGEWTTSLVVAADGRNSISRRAAGIATEKREFPQVALTTNLRHTRPHGNISTEFHAATGPFTLVPLPGMRSSLVWVLDSTTADAMKLLDDSALALEIEKHAHSVLGRMEIDGGRGVFHLSMETARTFAARRVALVGEAGHLLPPIGAQGLNLGIRDAATIAELAADSIRVGGDPGGDGVMHAYDERRRADVRSRALAVEMFNRSLLSDFLPVQMARGLGLELTSRVGFLRRALMRQGLGPRDDVASRLLRGEEV